MSTQKEPRAVTRRRRTSDDTWQAEKSRRTQAQILNATMQSLVEFGYAHITTEKIAKRAKVSRGAMTHHYKSRDDLLSAAAEFLAELRATEYDQAIDAIHLPSDSLPTLESMRETVAVLQKYFASPSYFAWQELVKGARAEKTLKQIVEPLEKALDEHISASIVGRFPVWADFPETSEILRDLILFSLQGIALNPVPYLKSRRLERLLDLLAEVAMGEFEKAYAAAKAPKAAKRSRTTKIAT